MNERTTLSLLIAQGPMTRVRLGEATGLSAPTMSQLVKHLTDAGLVCQDGHTSGARGPAAAIYRARTEAALGVAVHMRLGYAMGRVVDAADRHYPVVKVTVPHKSGGVFDDLARVIATACDAADLAVEKITDVCVGVPAAVSPDGDVLRFAEDVPGWPSRDVKTQLEERLGVGVIIENDANLAAVAEANARDGADDFVLLWQGEGLAIAAVADRRVHRGVSGGAGEIGYLPVSRAAAKLDPRACALQDLTGPTAVVALAGAQRPAITTYDGALQALRDGELRRALLPDLAARVAEALIPVIAILDPACIVLAGPTGAACGQEGADKVQAYLRLNTRWCTPIVTTVVPVEPVLRGAALTLSDHLAQKLLNRVG